MNTREIKEILQNSLAKKLNQPINLIDFIPTGGGSINKTYHLKINKRENFFLKLNSTAAFPDLFEKEKSGLQFLQQQNCIRIPSIILYEKNDKYQLLLLEWIEGGIRNESFWKTFGEQLAALHQVTNKSFGFTENNYMGALPQSNQWKDNWIDFFIDYRLRPQIELAREKKIFQKDHTDAFETLFRKIDSIFNKEQSSLLHGDLWSGNFMCSDQSSPVLIDPAVYFGHRSMDLAMTTLFGGFDKTFYDAYHYHFPLPANYREQWEICNIYPLLIHLNLFGEGYLYDITSTLKKYS